LLRRAKTAMKVPIYLVDEKDLVLEGIPPGR
jgi:hypothetical protein